MTKKLRVAVLVHSLNHNNIGRVYPFLQAHVGSAAIELVLIGWDSTGRLFPLLSNLSWPIVRLPAGSGAGRALDAALADCDLLHVFKNRDHLELALTRAPRLPLVLDLDDWELGLYLEGVGRWPVWRRLVWGYPMTRRIQHFLTLETLARTAPQALTVNSRALQGHFGGEIVYTAADAAAFAPGRADGAGFRERCGIPQEAAVVGFLGTPHPHKGIDELLEAFQLVTSRDQQARLLFVGVPGHNAYRQRLLGTPGVTVVDYLAPEAYPEAYAACDVLAIPQRAVTEGIMQTPAKLILGMAAGMAIVATTVGDMPDLLGDAGLLVAPHSPQDLAEAISTLQADPARRQMLGAAARARFLERLSLEQLGRTMAALYERLAGAHG